MFKKSLIAASLMAIAASANAATSVSSTSVEYATEIFGTTSVINNGTITLELDAPVEAGATADITFTLSEGTFAADPALAVGGGATGDAGISLKSGGNGSNEVVFSVAVTTGFVANDELVLTLTSLGGISSLSSDEASVTVTPAIDNTNLVPNGFDETIEPLAPATTIAAATTVATSSPGVTLTATSTTLDGVDVSDQTVFGTGEADALTADTVILFDELSVGTTGVVTELGFGNGFGLDADDTVSISVSGNFAADAVLCIVPTGDTDCANQVAAATVAGGVATFEVAGNISITDTDLLYIVDGVATIPTGDFNIEAAVDFNTATYVDTTYQEAPSATTTLGFDGLEPQENRINIITKPGAEDQTFIRVTNTNAEQTSVYITLTTQDGLTTLTGELDSIAGNATAVYTSEDIANAVGAPTWTGRGNATIQTSAPRENIVVVPLVRTNGVLVNQSAALTSEPLL